MSTLGGVASSGNSKSRPEESAPEAEVQTPALLPKRRVPPTRARVMWFSTVETWALAPWRASRPRVTTLMTPDTAPVP